MQIVTNARNLELTEPIKSHVQEKMGRLASHFDFVQEIHVILEIEKNPRIADNQLAEATVHVTGAVIRVEAASENLYTSIDRLVEKIERSLRKHKTKLMNRGSRSHGHDSIRRDVPVTADDEDDSDSGEYLQLDDALLDEETEVAIVDA